MIGVEGPIRIGLGIFRGGLFPLLCVLASLPPASLLPATVKAQIVVGRLTDAASGDPVEGALILLIRERGGEGEEDGYLTNSAGRFRLRADSSGTFRLQVERIGYATTLSPPFPLAQSQILYRDLATSQEPISLAGIDVEGEQRCVVRPEEGQTLARLWEEAAKALRAQEWTEGEGLYEYSVSNYERELGPEARRVYGETRESDSLVARLPYKALPVDELLTHGFIRQLEDGYYEFRAPDAQVLLSDPFLDSHCFQLTEDERLPGSIGLSFDPVMRGNRPDIEGTLWLERESGKLQFLEYRYTRVPYPGATHAAGGRVEFEALPNGTWIVTKWWIRMPRVARFRWPGLRALSGYRVTGFTEAGGDVREVQSSEVLVLRETPQGLLSGTVFDSIQGKPLARAEVAFSGTPYRAPTDSLGRFSMMELPEGVYAATLSHPMLDSLGVVLPGVEVEIAPNRVAEVQLHVPTYETLLASVCQTAEENLRTDENLRAGLPRQDQADLQTSALVGRVRVRGSGEPIPKATVSILWRDPEVSGLPLEGARLAGLDRTMTDMEGRYVACGLPPETELEVSATFMDHTSETRAIRGDAGAHAVLNLDIPLPPGALRIITSRQGRDSGQPNQGIQGRIMDPSTGAPVPNAEVTLRWTQGEFAPTGTTDALGRFRILSHWLGTFTLEARALGYKPVTADGLEIEPERLTMVELEMPPEPLELEPLLVVGEPRLLRLDVNGFYERADAGFGHFITPEKIERRQPVTVGDVLRDVPGVMVESTIMGTRVLFRHTGLNEQGDVETTCVPRVYVDGILVPASDPVLEGAVIDPVVPLGAIAGIEVHTRSTGLPLTYGGTQGTCGAILIWTKGGG